MSETKMQYPEISDAKENNGVLTFRISKCNVSIINAIRRTLISDIPTVSFKTDPHNKKNEPLTSIIINENTTSFTNEILKQRLACIPVHIEEFEKMPVDDLIVTLDKTNTTTSMQFITTNDFKIIEGKTNRELSPAVVAKIFPPSNITKNHILFTRLKPGISKNKSGQKISFRCKLFVATANDSGQFNVCCTSAYKNTTDEVKQTEAWSVEEEKLEKLMLTPENIAYKKINWYNHDSQRHYKNDSFDFKLETIGVYSNEVLVKKACNVLVESLTTFSAKMESDVFEITPNTISVKNSFDIKLTGYGYTIGKVIEYILHELFFKKQKVLDFVGFIKNHPHDDYSLIRIVFNDEQQANVSNIKSLFLTCVNTAVKMFNSVNESFI